MPLYHTGLWSLDDLDDAFISRPARSWKLILDECQLKSHSFDLHANLQFKERRGFPPVFIAVKTDDGEIESQQTREILIEARRRLAAQRALNLLRACHTIDSGDLFDDLDDPLAIPQDPHSPEDLAEGERESGLRRNFSAHHLGFAAGMAIKASYSRTLQYAIYKLFLSLQTVSVPLMNHHPRYSPRLYGVESEPANHVRLANAITLAYSAIEELQLEVRGSREKPARKEDGSWDPDTLADVSKRLTLAGIDLTSPIVWTIRGAPTRVHKMKRHPKGVPASWTSGPVRDQLVSIPDALRFAGSLRSSATTHKFVKESRSITVYDAHNLQHLARRLIMERLGCWPIDS
jgi:hypothetical protein